MAIWEKLKQSTKDKVIQTLTKFGRRIKRKQKITKIISEDGK